MDQLLHLLPQVIANGLLIGAIYSLAAMGLALIWGVMRIVNLAHGELIILGAYVAFWLFELAGLDPLLTIPIATALGLVLGLGLYWGLIRRIVLAPELTSLTVLYGLSIFMANLMLNLWKADPRAIPWMVFSLQLGPASLPVARTIAAGAAGAFALGLYLLLYRTYLGKAIRAIIQNRDAAAMVGIDVEAVYSLSLAIGVALALVSGVLISMASPFSPVAGGAYLIRAFAVVILGGLGHPLAALLGGLILGLVESGVGTYVSPGLSPAVAFLVMVLVLVARPRGLAGV